jgi:hypothetical protein
VQNVLISHTLVPGHGAVYTTFAQKAKKDLMQQILHIVRECGTITNKQIRQRKG